MATKPELLKTFFETQHRKWRDRAYTLIHFTCKNSLVTSNYGKLLSKPVGGKQGHPVQPYHPKRD